MSVPHMVRAVALDERPRATYRDDLVTVLLGAWFVIGLFLDAWAHNNRQVESFFTPWHAVFYTGFVASAAWMFWLTWRARRPAVPTLADVPVGYLLDVVALPLFAVAGLGDYAWHTVFGIEQNLTILFSPTHVLLVTSMLVIVTSPLRSAWVDRTLPPAPSLPRLLPAVLSVGLATTLVLLFVQYGNALVWRPESVVRVLSDPHGAGADLVSAIAVTNVVLLLPLLLLARRWQPPPGTATIVYASAAGLAGAITAFDNGVMLLAVVVAGVLVDLLLARLRPAESRRVAYLGFAALAPLVTWAVYLGAASIVAGGLPTVVEYWTGIPVVAAFTGLLLGAICLPSGARDPA